MKRMNIAVALNEKYFRYVYVMIHSLFLNNLDREIRVYVLQLDLSEASKENFRQLAGKYSGSIEYLDLRQEMFEGKLPVVGQWGIETYFRLALLDLLPEDVERILYLDADTIVNGSLSELYDADMQGCTILAAKEEQPTDEIRQKLFGERFDEGYAYFNSGVLLMDVGRLRKTYDLAYYMQRLKELHYEVTAPDQDLLNDLHWKEVGYLDGGKETDQNRYNLFGRYASSLGMTYEKMKETAVIIHYAGPKPWNADNTHFPGEQIWWDYAKQTPYYTEFCEEFVRKSMFDRKVPDYIQSLMKGYEEIRNQLEESLALNQKLLALINEQR